MHFFYLDEAGCTGTNLLDPDQPIFVLGGLSVRDEGWLRTHDEFIGIMQAFFAGKVPEDFELHASELLSPQGEGHFRGHSRDERNPLALDALDLLANRKHNVHLYAIDKGKLHAANGGPLASSGLTTPYLLAYDHLLTQIDDHIRTKLGASARGMLVIDVKEQHHAQVAEITRQRRSSGAKAHRLRRIVEFTQPVDSRRNTMVQLSDLIVYGTKRFLEIDLGFKAGTPQEATRFYDQCYERIDARRSRKRLTPRRGPGFGALDSLLAEVQATPRGKGKSRDKQ